MPEKAKTTAYQRLQKAAKNACANNTPAAKERLKKAEDAYKKSAEKKGKTATEIAAIVGRTKKCPAKK